MIIKLFPRDRARLLLIKEKLDRDYMKQITIHELIRDFKLYETKLRQGFKQEFGLTIADYISEKRLDNAAELLKNTDLQIQQIASKVGYKDISTFNRAFSNKFKTTPSAWRSSCMS